MHNLGGSFKFLGVVLNFDVKYRSRRYKNVPHLSVLSLPNPNSTFYVIESSLFIVKWILYWINGLKISISLQIWSSLLLFSSVLQLWQWSCSSNFYCLIFLFVHRLSSYFNTVLIYRAKFEIPLESCTLFFSVRNTDSQIIRSH